MYLQKGLATSVLVAGAFLCKQLALANVADEFGDSASIRHDDLLADASADSTLNAVDQAVTRKSAFGLNGDISGTGSYAFEMFFGGLVVMYLLFHVHGRMANRKIVDKWLSNYDSYWGDQFEATGSPQTAHAPDGAGDRLFQESACAYTYYATGRDHITSMLFKFHLRHRQDLIMWIYDTIFYPVEDKVTIEIVLDDSRACDPALFAVLNKTKVVPFREEHAGLKEIMVAHQLPGLGDGLVLLAEGADVAKELIPMSVLESITACSEHFEMLYFTDINATVPEGHATICPNVAYCTFRIPRDSKKIAPLFEMLTVLVDHVSKVRFPIAAKNRVDKNRRTIKELLEKLLLEKAKEDLEAKKLEKVEKEKQLRDTLSPQERTRLEDKEEKKRKKAEDKKKYKMKAM